MSKKLLIDDLIIKPKKVDIRLGTRQTSVWVRPAQDPERNMATALARKASRRLRNKLGDPKSAEFDALVTESLEGAEPESLRKIWANGRLIERALKIRNISLEEREYVPEPEGVGVTPKQMDEYEDKVEESEEEREAQLAKAIENAAHELDEEATKIDEKELYAEAIPSIVEIQCNNAYQTEFVHQIIFRCTFEDKKCTEKLFTDVEQVYALRASVLKLLTDEHIKLMLEPEAVKN